MPERAWLCMGVTDEWHPFCPYATVHKDRADEHSAHPGHWCMETNDGQHGPMWSDSLRREREADALINSYATGGRTMSTALDPIKADYTKPWVRGWEYVMQEGSGYIQRERAARGWSRADVYELTDYELDPNTQGLIEGEYGVGIPWEIDHLVTYATLFDTTPGALLDAIYEEKGRELLADD